MKAGRIAPPVSTPIAVTRAPAWLVMLVNMAGVSILLRLTACWSGSVNALAAIPLTAVSVACREPANTRRLRVVHLTDASPGQHLPIPNYCRGRNPLPRYPIEVQKAQRLFRAHNGGKAVAPVEDPRTS